jgi:hypothetical protein
LTKATREENAPAPFPHPVNFSQTLALALRAFRRHFPTLAALFCIPYVLTALLPLIVNVELSDSAAITAFLLSQVVLPVIFGSMVAAVAGLIITDGFVGLVLTVPQALRELRGRMDHVVIAGGVSALVALFFALFGPWLYVIMLLPMFFGPPILVQTITVEKKTFLEARRRMKELLAGQRLRTFMYLLSMALIAGVIAMTIFLSIAQQAVQGSQLDSSTYLVETIRGVVFGLAAAFIACGATVLYLGIRAERENLDHAELEEMRDTEI